jgi:hypothetical protein
MRYELSLIAYDVVGQVHVSARVYGTPDAPDELTELVWATTATTRLPENRTTTEWIREVLETTLAGLA